MKFLNPKMSGKKAFVLMSALALAVGLMSTSSASANMGDRGNDNRNYRFFREDMEQEGRSRFFRGDDDRRGDRDERFFRGDRDDRRGDRDERFFRGDRDDRRGGDWDRK